MPQIQPNPGARLKSFDEQAPGAPDFRVTGFALIFFATLIAYLPALRGAMLWDDASHITRSELRSLPGLWRIWFDLARRNSTIRYCTARSGSNTKSGETPCSDII